jgi:transposase-like protein
VAGRDYPGSYAELLTWFPDDETCLDYLDWLRWREGWRCPACACERGWRLGSGRRECADCGRQTSVTAGTVFHRTRTPLTVWFAAAWQMTSQKHGVSALGLQRVLGLGSYQTAWMMLQRLRAAMVRPGRKRLVHRVEVDETSLGGEEEGVQGRQTQEKSIVAIAVEVKQPRGFGRVRLARVPDVSASSLIPFVEASVEPGSEVLTDGWSGYRPLPVHGYEHTKTVLSASSDPAHVAMPAVHRVASLLKRWLLGTHQGSVSPEHLQAYLDEFAFRFNRRRSGRRGLLFYRLLEQAVATEPISYRKLVVNSQPKSRRPTAPAQRRVRPSSLALPSADRPWRVQLRPTAQGEVLT